MLHKRKEYVEITWRFHFYHILLYRRRKKLKKKCPGHITLMGVLHWYSWLLSSRKVTFTRIHVARNEWLSRVCQHGRSVINTCARSRIDWRVGHTVYISRRWGARWRRSQQPGNFFGPRYRIRFRILAAWTVASGIDTADRSARIYLSTVYTARERVLCVFCPAFARCARRI